MVPTIKVTIIKEGQYCQGKVMTPLHHSTLGLTSLNFGIYMPTEARQKLEQVNKILTVRPENRTPQVVWVVSQHIPLCFGHYNSNKFIPLLLSNLPTFPPSHYLSPSPFHLEQSRFKLILSQQLAVII